MTWTIRVNGIQTFIGIILFSIYTYTDSIIAGMAVVGFLVAGSLIFPRYHVIPASVAVYVVSQMYPVYSFEFAAVALLSAYTWFAILWQPMVLLTMLLGIVAIYLKSIFELICFELGIQYEHTILPKIGRLKYYKSRIFG